MAEFVMKVKLVEESHYEIPIEAGSREDAERMADGIWEAGGYLDLRDCEQTHYSNSGSGFYVDEG